MSLVVNIMRHVYQTGPEHPLHPQNPNSPLQPSNPTPPQTPGLPSFGIPKAACQVIDW